MSIQLNINGDMPKKIKAEAEKKAREILENIPGVAHTRFNVESDGKTAEMVLSSNTTTVNVDMISLNRSAEIENADKTNHPETMKNTKKKAAPKKVAPKKAAAKKAAPKKAASKKAAPKKAAPKKAAAATAPTSK